MTRSTERLPWGFFCFTVKYIFHFSVALPCFLYSKYNNSCWKQPNLALKVEICFYNVFCPAQQLDVVHLLHVLLGIFCIRILGFGQRYHSTSAMLIYLATFSENELINQELPGVSIWKLIASVYWQHWSYSSPKWLFSSREIQLFLSAENMSRWYFGKKLLTFSFTVCSISVKVLVKSPPINVSCETLSDLWIASNAM